MESSARSVSGSRPRIGPVLGLYRVVLLMGLLGVPHGLRCHRIAGSGTKKMPARSQKRPGDKEVRSTC